MAGNVDSAAIWGTKHAPRKRRSSAFVLSIVVCSKLVPHTYIGASRNIVRLSGQAPNALVTSASRVCPYKTALQLRDMAKSSPPPPQRFGKMPSARSGCIQLSTRTIPVHANYIFYSLRHIDVLSCLRISLLLIKTTYLTLFLDTACTVVRLFRLSSCSISIQTNGHIESIASYGLAKKRKKASVLAQGDAISLVA